MASNLRLAAIGDLHCAPTSAGSYRYTFEDLNNRVDILVLCGDLTRRGKISELEVVIENLAEVKIPVVAVLGNHDYHEKNDRRFRQMLREVGIKTLDGDTAEYKIDGRTVGFAGTKGFAGGFGLRALPNFGEELWRFFYQETIAEARKIEKALNELRTDLRIVVTHYAPVLMTLTGEDPQIYAFLGSSELANAIDKGGADLALHSHAHFGREVGYTSRGVLVRNVSEPLLNRSYAVFDIDWPSR